MPADKECVSYSLLDCDNICNTLADGGVWDFSHLDKSGTCKAMYRCVDDSVVYEFFDDYRTDFVLRDSALLLSCRETADTRRVYSPGIPILPTGTESQLTVEEIMSRWMSEYYISSPTVTVKLPEAGKLIFEPGDTICPVIMIEQQIESSYLGANADGRPVFSRDGNLRAQGKRRYMRYDRAGRVREEGICDDVVDESLWLTAEAADTTGIANAYVLKSYYYDSYDAVPDEW